jgi:hypothetical protein
MPIEQQWIDLIGGISTEDDGKKTLKEGATNVHERLKEGSIALEVVDEILSVRLQNMDAETWTTIHSCLVNYLGLDGAYLIGWLMLDVDMVVELDEFSPDVALFIRQVLALHGPEMQSAFAGWRELPDNWRGMTREVFLDQITGLYRIQLRIAKFNGDSVMFEGPPDSFLKLARNILITLQGLAPDFYGEAVLDEFMKDAQDFLEALGSGRGKSLAGVPDEPALDHAPSPVGESREGAPEGTHRPKR